MSECFKTSIPVAFADVDWARVLYFPRLFHYCHLAMEAFFADVVGMPYAQVLTVRNLGFPTVHAEADYHAPIRYGEPLSCHVTVRALGRSRVDFRFRFRVGDEGDDRAEARNTVVCAAMDRFKAEPLPLDLREIFQRYCEPTVIKPLH